MYICMYVCTYICSCSGKNVLGRGGFGAVYKSSYHGQTVAVKVFLPSAASMSNTTPNQLIRQEVHVHTYYVYMNMCM